MYADEALSWCLSLPNIKRVLDVGSGAGEQAASFRRAGKAVITIDRNNPAADFTCDFMTTNPGTFNDLVWCSHVLEHQRNVGAFLEKLRDCCNPGGYIAITVPPAKHEIVGGHLTIWNMGLLLYNMVLAGIDCREAWLKKYGYNLSVVVRYEGPIMLPDLAMDAGDLEKLQYWFPVKLTQNTNGDFG